ncbi:MAG: tyrosine-type recombinase/integrase [Xanthobacteraceae bacterium]
MQVGISKNSAKPGAITKIRRSPFPVPAVIGRAGQRASMRFVEFFTANIRNPNTRAAYARAVATFCVWCEERGQDFLGVSPVAIAAYVEQLLADGLARPTVKQHLAAVRMLFDYMVTGGILPFNPAASVRGPKHVVKKGKTPVLTPEEARQLLDSIDVESDSGLRDRALIGVMVFSFARVSAVVGMDVKDYSQRGKRWWLRLAEKGGKAHAVPVHHKAEEYLDVYLAALGNPAKGPLFRAMTKERRFGKTRLSRIDAFRMVKRRCADAGLGDTPNCHTFRATGIAAYLLNGGTIEGAQAIAAHESPRTTKLYDRTSDEITFAEIERIAI